MKTIILRNIPVRFTKALGTIGTVWVADHADDILCDAIGIGRTRIAAVRAFFDQIGG